MVIIGSFAIIHRGYLEILDKYPKADIYIISDDLAEKLYKLEIDLRKMPIRKVKQLLESLDRNVKILDKENIKTIKNEDQIIIIDDEVTQNLKEKYFRDHPNLIIETGFFYHPQESVYKTTQERVDLKKNFTDEDIQIMKQAKILAGESGCFWRQVGAIIVKDKKIILKAFNQMLPNKDECYKIGCIRDGIEPGKKPEYCSVTHAEANCIAQAAKKGQSLEDASIYVTTFPCPACAKLIALSGIKKCYFAEGWANFDGERVMKAYSVELIKIDL